MKTIRVSIMNTSKEIIDMLTEILNDAGYETSSIYTYLFKDENELFDDYVKINRPDVIVYDIAPPYRENYFFFEALFKRDSVKNIPFVLTTTNKNALESFVGKTPTHELIGKPFDLQDIIDAIKKSYTKKLSEDYAGKLNK